MNRLKKLIIAMTDEPHERWAWLGIIFATAGLAAKVFGLATLESEHILIVLILSICIAVWGKARKISAGPGGIDIEQ